MVGVESKRMFLRGNDMYSRINFSKYQSSKIFSHHRILSAFSKFSLKVYGKEATTIWFPQTSTPQMNKARMQRFLIYSPPYIYLKASLSLTKEKAKNPRTFAPPKTQYVYIYIRDVT